MPNHEATSASGLPFATVMRGYDRDQVNDFFRRFDAEMRVIAADRDAATANARELADNLEMARDEIEALRREVNKLSVPPTTVQGMSERVSSMLRLASDEASEIRARSEAEAAETLSIARQEAEEHRQDIARQTQEMRDRRDAMNAEHEATMSAAHDEAARIVAEAKAQAEELDARAQSNRERIQEDFDLTMAARRKEALEQAQHLEATSKAEAKERLDTARAEAESLRQRAASAATERVTRAQEVTEQIRTLRARMLAQLAEVRSQLDDVPQLLAEVHDEPELLDPDTKGLLNKELSDNARLEQPNQAAAPQDSGTSDEDTETDSSPDTVSAAYR
jgi:chromosome segregation ATPase